MKGAWKKQKFSRSGVEGVGLIKKIEERWTILEFRFKVKSYQINEQAVIICLFLEKGF